MAGVFKYHVRSYCNVPGILTMPAAAAAGARAPPQFAPNMDSDTIKTLIEQGLPGAKAAVSGADGVHFEATVVASAFAGKLPLARHRLVYATLGDLMGGAIHALSLKTMTPDEAGNRESEMGNRESG